MQRIKIIKGILKNPLDKAYVLVEEKYKDTDKVINKNYTIKPESLYWHRGERIYAKFDSADKVCLCPMLKGEAIHPRNKEEFAIHPTLETIKHYTKYKEEIEVSGYIEDDMFVIK